MRRVLPRFALGVCLLLCSLAHGQEAFSPLSSVSGQPRDALYHPILKELFIALYDRGRVAVIDPQGGRSVESIAVQNGPSALALSFDNNTLAVVNRLSNSVSLIDARTYAVKQTVSVGVGPSGAAGLPTGGFVVTNSFDDTLTLIDGSGAVSTVDAPGAVPGDVSVSDTYIALATRAPAAIHVYSSMNSKPKTINLDRAPRSVKALSAGRFVVQTDDELILIAGSNGRVLARRQGSTQAVSGAGDIVLALDGVTLLRFDTSLAQIDARAAVEGTAIVLAGAEVAILAPKENKAYLSGTPTTVVPIVEEAPEPEPREVPEVVEAEEVEKVEPEVDSSPKEPNEEPEVEEAEEFEAEPTPPPEPDPTPPPEPEVVVEPEPDPTPSPEPEVVVEPEPDPTPPPEPEVVMEPEPTPLPEPKVVVEPESKTTPLPEPEVVVEPELESEGPEPELVAADTPSRPSRITTEEFRSGKPSKIPTGVVRPHAPPLGLKSGNAIPPMSLADVMSIGAIFGDQSEGAFVPPVWTGEIHVMNSNRVEGNPEKFLTLRDGALLRIDQTLVAAEEIDLDIETSDMEARGNVVVEQGEAKLSADRVHFQSPPASEEDTRTSLLLVEDPEERAQARFRLGQFEAENIRIDEPYRKLTADSLKYDLANETGHVLNVEGQAGQVFFGADELVLHGPMSGEGSDVWITTCDHDPPHYRLRLSRAEIEDGEAVLGKNTRLQLGKADTPFFLPQWRSLRAGSSSGLNLEFYNGRRAELGYFINFANWWDITPEFSAALRLMPTEKEGVGFGLDVEYDYMNKPTSPWFRSKGSIESLYTTHERGYLHLYHRQELDLDTVLLVQHENWHDEEFYKDFFYDKYRDRTGPRTFINLTHHNQREYFQATASISPHRFTRETEKLPELSYHLVERHLGSNWYLTFDAVAGYYERANSHEESTRFDTVGRLTYNWDIAPGLFLTPYVQLDGTWYSKILDDDLTDSSDFHFSGVAGITAQSRLHRSYGAHLGFSGIKHIIVPSVTYSYRPDASLAAEQTPQFDSIDQRPGRSRIETKIDNIFIGRDAETEEEWQIARVSLYSGNDIQNEDRESDDYELEFDIRPRPWWGFQTIAEHHGVEDLDDDPLERFPYLFLLRNLRAGFRDIILRAEPQEEPQDGDFDRVLSYLYYDDGPHGGKFNGVLGFAYTDTDGDVFNREVLYGIGYQFSENWSASFEHRYDLERDELSRQSYEIRRRLHCWEAALEFTDRESGFDISFELSLTAFPGAKVRF